MPTRSKSDVNDDHAFVMMCLQHTPGMPKPNFDEVAKKLGLKSSTCYHRHWSIMKKWGMAGLSGRGRKGGHKNAASIAQVAGKKRQKALAAQEESSQDDEKDAELVDQDDAPKHKKAKAVAPAESEEETVKIEADEDADELA